MSRFQGQQIGFIVGTEKDFHTVVHRLPHGELQKAPKIGDLVRIEDRDTHREWLARVESEKHVSIDLRENEIRDAIARGQYLETELHDREKAMYLGHDFTVRVLGRLTQEDPPGFRPIVRNLPARGSRLYHLKPSTLQRLVMLDKDGATLGHYAVGDEVHDREPDALPVRFDVRRFVSRRTGVFGASGFGKSNLVKTLVAYLTVLTSEDPKVGKLVFDLDGEYAFETDQGKGLADIGAVKKNAVVFSNSARAQRQEYAEAYAGPARFSLLEIHPARAVSILFPDWRQERVYIDLLRSTTRERWQQAIKLIDEQGRQTPVEDLADVLGLDSSQDRSSVEAMVRALDPLIRRAHDPNSTLMSEVYDALSLGATVIVDLSQMSLSSAFNTMTLIIDDLFDQNQQAFVSGSHLPEIVVFVEEAQNLLSDKQVREDTPIVRLAKEGRKYNLGLVYVTQQPGAIAGEILSQTNTFFASHLLAKQDIKALTDVNPHYGGVIADFIQVESIQGQTYIYSSVPNMPIQSYVFGTKALAFDDVSDRLAELQPEGYRAYTQRRLEYVKGVSEKIEPLITAPPDQRDQQYDYYKQWRIAKVLHRQLPDHWPITASWAEDLVGYSWIRAALEDLGIRCDRQRMRFPEDQKEYWYLCIERPESEIDYSDEEEEIPF